MIFICRNICLNGFRDCYGSVTLHNDIVDPNLCGVFRRGEFQRKLN